MEALGRWDVGGVLWGGFASCNFLVGFLVVDGVVLDLGEGCVDDAAGGAAHLPGMVAANTILPVIGVPVESSALSGLDSLLSIVQIRSL